MTIQCGNKMRSDKLCKRKDKMILVKGVCRDILMFLHCCILAIDFKFFLNENERIKKFVIM
jgi:hypothetical protein